MGKLTRVNLEKTENGWIVEASYLQEGKESYDTDEKKFVFPTLDEAVICIKQIAETG